MTSSGFRRTESHMIQLLHLVAISHLTGFRFVAIEHPLLLQSVKSRNEDDSVPQ